MGTNAIPVGGLRSGVKTSEFWITVLTLVMAASAQVIAFLNHQPVDYVGTLVAGATALGYIGSRTVVKKGAARQTHGSGTGGVVTLIGGTSSTGGVAPPA